MGALNSVPFCSRSTPDDNNNLGDRPDLNLSDDEAPHVQCGTVPAVPVQCGGTVIVDSQPEATSTPKAVRIEESGDLAIVHNTQPPRVHTTPPPYNSMDGDSGLEHSADDDQEQSGDEERLSEDGAGRSIHSEDLNIDDQVDVDLNGTLSEEDNDEPETPAKKETVEAAISVTKPAINHYKEKIDFAQLEEEILGDDMVEPITDTTDENEPEDLVDDLDIADSTAVMGKLGKRNTNTTDMITDMLNQMVVDGGSRDLASR